MSCNNLPRMVYQITPTGQVVTLFFSDQYLINSLKIYSNNCFEYEQHNNLPLPEEVSVYFILLGRCEQKCEFVTTTPGLPLLFNGSKKTGVRLFATKSLILSQLNHLWLSFSQDILVY